MKKTQKVPPKDAIEQALLKKALGYECDEIIEEYAKDDEGCLVLIKKRVTKKHISPDIPAAKMLLEKLEDSQDKYETMTDSQLLEEKMRLIKLLEQGENNANK